MSNSPCQDCNNRFVGCHSQCAEYKAWRESMDQISKNRAEQNKYYRNTGEIQWYGYSKRR